MTTFFFHILRKDGVRIEDFEGQDFADLAAARSDAVVAAREMVSDAALHGLSAAGGSIEIADVDGEVLSTVPLLAA